MTSKAGNKKAEMPPPTITSPVTSQANANTVQAKELPTPVVKEEKKKMPDLKSKQDEYFKNLMSEVPGSTFQAESENTVDKASQKVIDHIIYGHLNIQSSPAKKNDIIEGSIIEKKLQDAQKLKEELKSQLSSIEHRIDSLASQKIDNPKSLYSHPVMKQYMEDNAEKKRKEALRFIKKMQKQKDSFEEKIKKKQQQKLSKLESEAAQLARDEKKTEEQNARTKEERFKQKILQIKKRQETRVKQLKEFEEIYNKKIKKDISRRPLYVRERRKYHSEESVFRENKLKEMKEKKKAFSRISSIDFKAHQKNYFEALKKLEAEKKSQREKEFEKMCAKQPEAHFVYDSSKLFGNKLASSTFKKEDESEEITKLNAKRIVEARQKFSEGLKQHQQIIPSKHKQLELDIYIDKQEHPEKYISLIKKKSDQQRFEEIASKGRLLRSDPNNESTTSLLKSSVSVSNFKTYSSQGQIGNTTRWYGIKPEDEKIFKEQIKGGFVKQDVGKEKEIGKMYLKSIQESIQKHNEHLKYRQNNHIEPQQGQLIDQEISKEEAHSNFKQNTGDTSPAFEKSKLVLPKIATSRTDSFKPPLRNSTSNVMKSENSQAEYNQYYAFNDSLITSERVQQQPKTNYMFEIRRKFNLDNRKEQWEKVSDGTVSLPAISKQKILQDASVRLDEDIKRREQLMKFNRSSDLSLKEVQERQDLDDAYFKSIKAKIAFMKVTLDDHPENGDASKQMTLSAHPQKEVLPKINQKERHA